MTDPVGPPPQGMIEGMQHLMGGAFTTLAAALTGRAMYHAGEVRARHRPILSWDLLWELPLAIGMALIGEGLGEYLGLSSVVQTAGIAALAYLGPRGAGALIEKYLTRKGGE